MIALIPPPVSERPGYFGPYGGRYVPETLIPALEELEQAFEEALRDPEFLREFEALLRTYVGRPTPLTEARRLGEAVGARIFLKREDLAHTGAHKINNALGQALLAKRLGKRRVVAETGAGQHGVATATACALLGLECVIYMGTADMARQRPNVFRMRLLGAEVRPVDAGSCTLKDAINEAIRDWVTNVRTAQRVPDALARRRGAPGGRRLLHPEGRHQRGHPGLGDERAHDPLPAGLRPGAPSVSRHRAHLPVGDRR